MAFVTLTGTAYTITHALGVDDSAPTISASDVQKILNLLGDDGYSFLTLHDTTDNKEVVKVSAEEGQLIWTRGLDGKARNWPKGSCLVPEVSWPAIWDQICQYDCCAEPCPVDPVTVAGTELRNGIVGVPWSGAIIFGGDLPMVVAAGSVPPWVTVTIGRNYVQFEGTPLVPGLYSFAASATNQAGELAVASATITIAES